MYNDHLSDREAQQFINERVQEAESYSELKRLGYGDNRVARWVFVLIIILAAALAFSALF
jgi:hypothetical protein